MAESPPTITFPDDDTLVAQMNTLNERGYSLGDSFTRLAYSIVHDNYSPTLFENLPWEAQERWYKAIYAVTLLASHVVLPEREKK